MRFHIILISQQNGSSLDLKTDAIANLLNPFGTTVVPLERYVGYA